MFAPMAFRMDCNILLSDDTMGFIISKYYFYIYTSIACPTTRYAQQAVDYTGGGASSPWFANQVWYAKNEFAPI